LPCNALSVIFPAGLHALAQLGGVDVKKRPDRMASRIVRGCRSLPQTPHKASEWSGLGWNPDSDEDACEQKLNLSGAEHCYSLVENMVKDHVRLIDTRLAEVDRQVQLARADAETRFSEADARLTRLILAEVQERTTACNEARKDQEHLSERVEAQIADLQRSLAENIQRWLLWQEEGRSAIHQSQTEISEHGSRLEAVTKDCDGTVQRTKTMQALLEEMAVVISRLEVAKRDCEATEASIMPLQSTAAMERRIDSLEQMITKIRCSTSDHDARMAVFEKGARLIWLDPLRPDDFATAHGDKAAKDQGIFPLSDRSSDAALRQARKLVMGSGTAKEDSVRRSGQRLALDPRLDISPPPPGSVELSCESDLTQRGSESPPSLPPSYRSHQVVKQVSSRPAKTPTKSQSLSRMSSRKRDDKGAQRRASASPTPSPKQQTYPSTAFTAPRVTSTSPEREGGRTAASTSQARSQRRRGVSTDRFAVRALGSRAGSPAPCRNEPTSV